MPTKQKILTELTRDELWDIVDGYALPVEDRRRLDHLHTAARRLPKSKLREILLNFDRDRLKEICRALDLDESGKLKAEIVDLLVVVRNDDDDDENEDEDDSRDDDSGSGSRLKPSTKNAMVLDELSRGELLYVIDQYGLVVEDRRRRETVRDAAAKVSSIQLGTVLEQFPRDRLKEVCRALGIDDSGKRKDEIISRMLGEPPQNDGKEHDSGEGKLSAKRERPRLFIGSTVEALPVAREVQAELHREFQVTPWNQSLFSPGGASTWSQLVEMARNNFDFALLVFSTDDIVESRGGSTLAPRDNVLLEYGLFVGAIGPERTFFLYNHDHRPKIASDLAGVTALTYGDRDDDNLQAAVGPACQELRRRDAKLGRLTR